MKIGRLDEAANTWVMRLYRFQLNNTCSSISALAYAVKAIMATGQYSWLYPPFSLPDGLLSACCGFPLTFLLNNVSCLNPLWMIVVGRARPRALSFSFFCSLSHPVWLTGRLDSINKLGSTRNNCMRVCVHACPCGNHLKSLTCLSCLHIWNKHLLTFSFWVFHRVRFSDFNNGAPRAAGVCVYYKWVSMSGACPRCPTCVIGWNLRILQTDRASFSVSSSLFSFWEDSDSFQDSC